MKKASVAVLAIILCLTGGVALAKKKSSGSESSPSVAVAQVRGENISLNQNTAQSIKDLAIDSCVKAGLRCLERQDIGSIREEQQLAASDEAAPGQNKARKGHFKTADYMVSCALTGSTADAAGVGVAVNNKLFNTFGLKGVGVQTDRVTMTCRAYDTSTSEIILSQTNNKMAMTGELVVFNAKSSMAKTVEKAMDKFFKELKNQID
ncbi:MAG: hypothetical protein HY073_01515 [Deltaproteobacteria bacterium]|nr:hypothetical protein [Deltaproteobacteria bacterium]